MSTIVVGIDASRNRSGGAIANLVGILSEGNPYVHGIGEVHVWSYRRLLESLPDTSWLVKHNPPDLERSLFSQIWWQYHKLPKEARRVGCDVLYSTDASSVCRYHPMVVMSQDMLSYEPHVMKYYGISKARLRLMALLVIQNRAMRHANGVIFLTKYAATVIRETTGQLKSSVIIPHGVDQAFKRESQGRLWPTKGNQQIRCLYVSNAAMYKNQWRVVRAIYLLRRRGYKIQLILAGGGTGRAQQLLDDEIAQSDPQRSFVESKGCVPHDELPELLAGVDLFVFASSCENLPVTLLEAMATGLPIVCSNRGPMPEVLLDGGVYCDPEDPDSIAGAIEKLIVNDDLRRSIAMRAKELSARYTWKRCAEETWDFIRDTVRK